MGEKRRQEYSYFRAAGASLDAVLTVERMTEDVKSVEQKLYDKYKAVMASVYPGGKLSMVFNAGASPEDWVDTGRSLGGNTLYESKKPAPGTKDAQYLEALQGIVDGYVGKERLENIFGCGDMPMKSLPANARYSDKFVLYQTVEDKDAPQGMMRATNATCSWSNSAIRSSDNLTHLKMGGAYYIRVPNDENGAPRFTPPDAEPVDIEEVLEIDALEFRRKRAAELSGKKYTP